MSDQEQNQQRIQAAIDSAHRALVANIEAGQSAAKRNAPAETLEYHIDLAHKALKNLRTLSISVDLPAHLKSQAS